MPLTVNTIKTIFTSDISGLKRDAATLQKEFSRTRKEMDSTARAAEKNQFILSKSLSAAGAIAKGAAKAFLAVTGSLGGALLALEGVAKASQFFAKDAATAAVNTAKLGAAASDLCGSRFPRLSRAFEIVSVGATHLLLQVTKVANGLALFAAGTVKGDANMRRAGLTMAKFGLSFFGLGKAAKVAADQVKGFTQSTVKTGKSLGRFGLAIAPVASKLSRMIGIVGSLSGSLLGMGAIAVAGAVFWLTKFVDRVLAGSIESAKMADALGKTASFLGVNAEKLQQYQFAASLSGVSQEKFNVGLQRFLRRTAEARQGTGVLVKEFDRLKIALDDGNGNVRSGMDIFQDYLDVIANTKDSQEQLRLAFAAFDTEGVRLVNLAKQGRDGIDGLRRAAEELGVVLPNSLIRTYEEINDQLEINSRRIEVAELKNDLFLAKIAVKWDSLKTSIKLATLQFWEFLRPLEAFTTSELERKLESAEKRVEKLSQKVSLPFNLGEIALGAGSGELGVAIRERNDIRDALAKAREEAPAAPVVRPDAITQQITQQIDTIHRQVEEETRLAAALKISGDARKRVADAIFIENQVRALGKDATQDEIRTTREAATQLVETQRRIERYTEARKEQEDAAKKAAQAERKLLEEAKREQSQITTTLVELRFQASEQRRLNEALQEGEQAHKRMANAIELERSQRSLGANATAEQRRELTILTMELQRERDLNQDLVSKRGSDLGFRESLKAQLEGVRASGDLVASSISSIADNFIDAITSGENFGKVMKNVFRSLTADIAKAALKQVLLNSLINGLGGVFGSSSGGSSTINTLGNGGLQFAGYAANGGYFPSGSFGVVGEEGPELISGPANITPLKGLTAAGGTQVIINNNAPGVEVSTSESTGPNGEKHITAEITRIVSEDIRRGGPINKSIQTSFRGVTTATRSR